MNRILIEITAELFDFMNEWDYYTLHDELLDNDQIFDEIYNQIVKDPVAVIAYLQEFEYEEMEQQANQIIAEIKQISNL